jgi:diguanylate cyclase (GGDEF)-like protein
MDSKLFYSLYFFIEYLFGLLFIAGCQSRVKGIQIQKRYAYFLLPALAVALVLPHVFHDLNRLLMIHAVLAAALFATALVMLRRLMTSVPGEVEQANYKLFEARDQLELLVQMDPLTEALNRHAFHSLLRRPEKGEESKTSGSVAVIDIDNLKPINDNFGHTVGDKAIRAVARAMRSLVRADDMLFRWGGDEFLVLMFNLPQSEAWRRMEKLNEILDETCRRWINLPVTVTFSYGVAGFNSLTDLGDAIETADKAMYAQRHQVRGIAKPAELPQHT